MTPLRISETQGALPRLLISSANISLMWGRNPESDIVLSPAVSR